MSIAFEVFSQNILIWHRYKWMATCWRNANEPCILIDVMNILVNKVIFYNLYHTQYIADYLIFIYVIITYPFLILRNFSSRELHSSISTTNIHEVYKLQVLTKFLFNFVSRSSLPQSPLATEGSLQVVLNIDFLPRSFNLIRVPQLCSSIPQYSSREYF